MCIEFQRRITKRSSICPLALINNQVGGACVTERVSAFLLFSAHWLLFLNVKKKFHSSKYFFFVAWAFFLFFIVFLVSLFSPRRRDDFSPSLPFLSLCWLLYSHFSQCARQVECQIECAQKNEKKNFKKGLVSRKESFSL